MAAAAVQQPFGHAALGPLGARQLGAQLDIVSKESTALQDVQTELHYFKANEDGSPPHPTYVDKPETYARPFETHPATIHDVRGSEDKYTLDGNGFQIHSHTATEKDFLDDDQIKAVYYPEVEQLLKDA